MHIMCIPWLYIIVLMSFPEMGVSARMGFTPGPLSFQTFFKLWNPRTQWVDQWRFLDGKVMGKSSMNPGCSVAMLDCRRVKKKKQNQMASVFLQNRWTKMGSWGIFQTNPNTPLFSQTHVAWPPNPLPSSSSSKPRSEPGVSSICDKAGWWTLQAATFIIPLWIRMIPRELHKVKPPKRCSKMRSSPKAKSSPVFSSCFIRNKRI